MENIPVRSIKATQTLSVLPDTFKIRTVTEVLQGKDLVHDLHRHDFYFILALEEGTGTHEIDFTPYPVNNNSLFCIRPGQVHRLTLKAGSKGYLVEFARGYLANDSHILRKAVSQTLYVLETKDSARLHGILSSVHEEYSNRKEGFGEIIKANLSIFFIELMRQQKHANTSDVRDDYAQEKLQRFLELIEKEIGTHKEVSHYADRLSLSQFQLNSITKKLVGKTAAQLIDDHILLESKRYLLASSNQVNQIAYHLGYEDVSYFIRFFKKHTGLTPEIFRQNLR